MHYIIYSAGVRGVEVCGDHMIPCWLAVWDHMIPCCHTIALKLIALVVGCCQLALGGCTHHLLT